jgi:hypothetical protein
LEKLYVPTVFAEMKAVFVFFEFMIHTVEVVLRDVIVVFVSLVDAFACNIFKDPWNCAAGKICYLLTPNDFTLATAIVIGELVFPIYIPVSLRTEICTKLLRINPWICPTTCDSCSYQAFGVAVIPSAFTYYANLYHFYKANAPYSYIPCNIVSGCCNSAYSLLPSLIS